MKLAGSKEISLPTHSPAPSRDGCTQQLHSTVFCADFCLQLNELLVNMEGMGNHIYKLESVGSIPLCIDEILCIMTV
jgi:hypothetical protein